MGLLIDRGRIQEEQAKVMREREVLPARCSESSKVAMGGAQNGRLCQRRPSLFSNRNPGLVLSADQVAVLAGHASPKREGSGSACSFNNRFGVAGPVHGIGIPIG